MLNQSGANVEIEQKDLRVGMCMMSIYSYQNKCRLFLPLSSGLYEGMDVIHAFRPGVQNEEVRD